jgi:hypothetical protein
MKGKAILKVLTGIIILALLLKLITSFYIESLLKDKIQSALNKPGNKYTIEIKKVHIVFWEAGIEIDSIAIYTDPSVETYGDLNGRISSVKITGIHLLKAIFHHDYHVNLLTISEPVIIGRIPFPKKAAKAVLSPYNIRIELACFDRIGLDLRNKSNSRSYRLKNGILKLYNFHVDKKDTLSQRIISQFHFQSEEIQAVTSDSIYTITGKGVLFSALSHTLEIKDFSIMPNYSDNKFMARFKYETDKIEARFKNIYIHDFQVVDYVRSGDISSSYSKIGDMDIRVYRDKRKKFRHKIKPTFQEIVYNYHAPLKIDSIGILHGNVIYMEMVDNAKAYGRITFSDIKATICGVTNDSAYKEKEAFLKLKAEAMFMDKSQIKVSLKARLFDPQNTFTMTGRLSGLEIKALNPMLENSAFVVATAGKIDTMNFNFVANNTKATGRMKLFYHGLAVTVKNKETGDTTGLKQKLMTFIANRKLIDANPLPGKEIREGEIDHMRDPERFLFNYCFRSIFSGIRTTILKNPPEEKKPKD